MTPTQRRCRIVFFAAVLAAPTVISCAAYFAALARDLRRR